MHALIILAIVLWIICGVLSYRLAREMFRREFQKWRVADRRFFLVVSLLGPIGVFAILLSGWMCFGESESKW